MKAIRFKGSVPRYAFSMATGKISSKNYYNVLSNLSLVDIAPPALPSEQWVRIKPTYGGICGSDMGLILLKDSLYTSPFVSFPFTIGHENCGTITELGKEVQDLKIGMRVVVDPLLPCKTRGFVDYCPNCLDNNESRCLRFTKGNIKPGLLIGTCKDTGGSWSESFVAHSSQVYPLSASTSWEEAILCDTLASALHPLMGSFPSNNDKVLIIGGGPIGLCLIYALRALDFKGSITVLAKYPFQGEKALGAGASKVIYLDDKYRKNLVETYDMELLPALIGSPIPFGGAEVIFDCVGSSKSIKDSLDFASPGGNITIIGLAGSPKGIDWTPIWLKELTIKGFFAFSTEEFQGEKKSTYGLALDLIENKALDLAHLLTHVFPLEDYKEAIVTNLNKGANRVIKTAFKI